jgi:saccharopine dehydrogenase (NAD+, L-lysine-forming)
VEEPTLVYKNGAFKELPHFSGEEQWRFPDPIGVLTIFNCYHDEVDTIPRAYPQVLKNPQNVEFKYALSERSKNALIFLKELGLTRSTPIEVGGQQVVPIEVVAKLLPDPQDLIGKAKGQGCIVVEVQGTKEGKRASRIYYTTADNDDAFSKYKTNFTALLTGLAPAILVECMAKGLDNKGVLLPHCVDPGLILEEYGKVCQVGEL